MFKKLLLTLPVMSRRGRHFSIIPPRFSPFLTLEAKLFRTYPINTHEVIYMVTFTWSDTLYVYKNPV